MCCINWVKHLPPTSDGLVRPLHPEEYLFDFLLEDGSITLSFRRILWGTPLSFENELFLDFHYQQVTGIFKAIWTEAQLQDSPALHLWLCMQLLEDYLSGQLKLGPSNGGSSLVREVAELAALQHLARGATEPPTLWVWHSYSCLIYNDDFFWQNQKTCILF